MIEAPSIGGRGLPGAARRLLWWSGWPARMVLIGLIRLYRVTLSGLLGGQCRFEPSCSHYAERAIRARGAAAGSVLAAWRILRCNPFARGGRDDPPVPVACDSVIQQERDAA